MPVARDSTMRRSSAYTSTLDSRSPLASRRRSRTRRQGTSSRALVKGFGGQRFLARTSPDLVTGNEGGAAVVCGAPSGGSGVRTVYPVTPLQPLPGAVPAKQGGPGAYYTANCSVFRLTCLRMSLSLIHI